MRIDIKDLKREDKLAHLIRFMRTIEGVEEAGWFEHTSDWDPALVIVTAKETIETAAGYTEIEINHYKRNRSTSASSDKMETIQVYVDNEEDLENPTVTYINVDEIQSITWIPN